MQGITESFNWYQEKLLPMLEKEFCDLLPRLAIGIAGRGSECFGFDDDISRDHDFSVACTIWMTQEDETEYGFKLSRSYKKLLDQEGISNLASAASLFGENERQVMTIDEFFRRRIGIPAAPESWQEWLYTPEHALAEAVNGKVFRDELGVFTKTREKILYGMPEDVRLKKLASRAVMMAQSGQYNYPRCLDHNEPGAAAMALGEFVRNAVSMVFLLNFKFAPYYKWMFRAMRQLDNYSTMADKLEYLLTKEAPEMEKCKTISDICFQVTKALHEQGIISKTDDPYLEPVALEITSQIRNRSIRSLHIMEG